MHLLRIRNEGSLSSVYQGMSYLERYLCIAGKEYVEYEVQKWFSVCSEPEQVMETRST